MKRILFVTRDLSYIGGTEEFIKNLLVYLSNKEKLKFFLFEIEGHGKFSNKEIYEILKKHGVKLLSFDKEQQDICSLNKIRALISIIEKYRIDIVHSFLFNADFITCAAKIGPRFLWSNLSKIKSFRKFRMIIPSSDKLRTSRIKPTTFHWFSSKMIDTSVALEVESPEWIERKRIIDEEIEPIVSKYCDVVLPVYKSGIKKWSRFSRNIALIPCASITAQDLKKLDNKRLNRRLLRSVYKLNPEDRLFVSVARLVPEKGLDKLINMFANEEASTKNILFIAGSGPLERKLKHMASKAKNIRFLGHMNRDRIFDLLTICDVFVLLSRSEGFPLAIQEAMAARKPIWATEVGGIPDLVSRKNGIFSGVDDDVSINVAFMWLKKQKNGILEQMGQESRARIIRFFLVERIGDKLMKLYLSK